MRQLLHFPCFEGNDAVNLSLSRLENASAPPTVSPLPLTPLSIIKTNDFAADFGTIQN